MWYAKPRGGYAFTDPEGLGNIQEIYNTLNAEGYTVESIAGIVGNMMAESSLNPWRWQGDTVAMYGGYGLFQFTPAKQYFDTASSLPGYSPNMSTTEITSGATPMDGMAQLAAFATDLLGKWTPYAWRPYWSQSSYPQLWLDRNYMITHWGYNGGMPMDSFKTIDNVYYAAFAFLACYEGPAVPNMDIREQYANRAYEILTGMHPVPPIHGKKGMPLWMYIRPFF